MMLRSLSCAREPQSGKGGVRSFPAVPLLLPARSEGNSSIPAGFTYLGQFIDVSCTGLCTNQALRLKREYRLTDAGAQVIDWWSEGAPASNGRSSPPPLTGPSPNCRSQLSGGRMSRQGTRMTELIVGADQSDTHQKALRINLDPRWYGTIAEIGAGSPPTMTPGRPWCPRKSPISSSAAVSSVTRRPPGLAASASAPPLRAAGDPPIAERIVGPKGALSG